MNGHAPTDGHVLTITLGPVQDFIAQARRTRDLWFGSHLLSEVSKAAAKFLAEAGAELVFPALQREAHELDPCDRPFRDDGSATFNVANKIVALLRTGADPAPVVAGARDAAKRRLVALAEAVRGECSALLAPGTTEVWDEQVDSALEFTAAWAPLDGQDGYKSARQRAGDAVDARKSLREFSPWTRQRGTGVPKSGLDGARETVLKEGEERPENLARRYQIPAGEQLDAIGLTKRAGGKPGQFVPVANVAFAAWLDRVAEVAPGEVEAIGDVCRRADVSPVRRPDLKWTRSFGFDAQVFMEERLRGLLDETGHPDACRELEVRLADLRRRLAPEAGRPYPYVACLVADGDRVGSALDGLATPDEHRAFSRALSRFAERARQIVEHEHKGLLVYSGGDDALAFLPLQTAIDCAADLWQSYKDEMEAFPDTTLSVGIGIGHVLEGMGDLRELGREAEQLAKSLRDPDLPADEERPEALRDRNAIGIVVDKRSGGKITLRARWDAGDIVEEIGGAVAALSSDALSVKKVYEVGANLRRFPGPAKKQGEDDDAWARVLADDVRRTIARTEGAAGSAPDQLGLKLPEGASYADVHRAVRNWVSLMLVARTFAEAHRAMPAPAAAKR